MTEIEQEQVYTTSEALQRTAEDHLDLCFLWMDDGDDEKAEYRQRAGLDAFEPSAPFCGCTTCIVREVLTVSMNALLDMVKQLAEHAEQERRDDDLQRRWPWRGRRTERHD